MLTRSLSSAWWFYKGNVKRRIGFKDHFRTPLLTDPLTIPENEEFEHQVLTYKRLLAPLGIALSDTKPKLFLSPETVEAARTVLEEHGIQKDHFIVGINPGAAFGSAKCWPQERFKELTAMLLQHPDVRIVFFGDSVSKPLVDAISAPFTERVVNLAGKTSLKAFTALLSLANVLVTNDSGPMHVAAALKTPLVALFGSTNAVKTGPYLNGTVIHKHTLCSPCYKRTCPIDFRCMTSITASEVYSAIQATVHHDPRISR